MKEDIKDLIEKTKEKSARPLVSTVLDDGTIVEMAYRPKEHRTLYYVAKGGEWREEPNLLINGRRFVPYSPGNNLIRNEVVLLPSEPEEYGSEEELIGEIQGFIHRYVQVSPLFEKIAAYYVLFSWVYDSFNELPYLRARGDYGSGKTRFLLIVGSLCYKPIFASGASTVSPIFRILDSFRGTLILDESDFRFSDEKAELVKILNNGNAKGFPVLRSEATIQKEFNPRAYRVYGPKIVASRGQFEDKALESRFLTEEMGQEKLREDIPINLPFTARDEALHLRNKLLFFRFRNLHNRRVSDALVDRTIEPRLNQIFVPLLSVITDDKTRDDLKNLARQYNGDLVTDRGMTVEAQVLEVIRDMLAAGETRLTVKDITNWFADRHGDECERKVTPKWIGWIIRRRLSITTRKSDGNFIIELTASSLQRLLERYGLAEPNDSGSSGTSGMLEVAGT